MVSTGNRDSSPGEETISKKTPAEQSPAGVGSEDNGISYSLQKVLS